VTSSQFVLLGAAEAVAMWFVVQLWRKHRQLSVISRLVWSGILLVPVLGVIYYGFCFENPEEHPYL